MSEGMGFNAYGILLVQAPFTTNSTTAPVSTSALTTAAAVSSQTQSSATATSTPTYPDSTATSTPATAGSTNTTSGLTSGAIAGVAIGAVAGCGALAALIWFAFRAGKRKGISERPRWLSENPAELPDRQMDVRPQHPQELVVEERPGELGPPGRHELASKSLLRH
ncbi:hypothetical protein LTR91_008114 [Friedmanniomyces endolithicus]|uniref:Mid2 domain-containing protein n=1 Tax=Friedmanniomyces endolithicus TaxID=329885 RepID=A0AAN6QVJ7_9PEZI|nr:hypothetical protein LTR59_007994 [Friedmanniomyces endolithicus]KAK0816972.1 hypothetical protein LTR75_003326 [Friedmanniomyces endolithicus]KAK0885912.1 hypothetical protein LTR87_000616 [Friedmanniomyces endolithicus]KAK0924813.1 hypothetical protein LTR57_005434 [Friedmanniomyces endolithicus]KAK0964075.1 hypothetical protein LTS01_018979 [Friedmanniomyces endolithicus]